MQFHTAIRLQNLPDFIALTKHLEKLGIRIHRSIHYNEYDVVFKMAKKRIGRTNAKICERAFRRDPITCFIATKNRRVIGFICYNSFYNGVVGPIWVERIPNRQDIAKGLLLSSLWSLEEEDYYYAFFANQIPLYYTNGLDTMTLNSKIIKQGWENKYYVGSYDVLIDLRHLPKPQRIVGVHVRRAEQRDKVALTKWYKRKTEPADTALNWKDHIDAAFKQKLIPIFVAVSKKRVIGFVFYNSPSKGDLTPVEVKENYRGRGIAKALCTNCFHSLAKEGYLYVVVADTSLGPFFDKFIKNIKVENSQLYRDVVWVTPEEELRLALTGFDRFGFVFLDNEAKMRDVSRKLKHRIGPRRFLVFGSPKRGYYLISRKFYETHVQSVISTLGGRNKRVNQIAYGAGLPQRECRAILSALKEEGIVIEKNDCFRMKA